MAEASIETLASGAIAAGCLQAVMSMVHPELVKFVAFQKQRVARRDAEQERNGTSRHFRRRAADADAEGLSPEQQTDVSFQLKYLRRHWHSHLRFFGLDAELPAVVQRALLYRNKVAHQSQLTLAQYEHAIATFERLADIIECNTLIRQQIRELVAKLLSFSSLGKTPEATNQVEDKPKMKESKTGLLDPVSLEPTPPPASLEQILQHNFLYDGDENEDPLWVDLKLIGNDYFKEGNYTEAIEAYSQALDVAPNQAVLLGNRAMCYLRLKEFECAREDAEDALDADNYENVKYYRLLSEAMMGMKDYGEAKEICVEGLELDQNDATLLSRRRTAEAMIQKEKAEYEKEKKRLELEERAKGMENLRIAGEAGVAEAWFRLGVLYSSSVRKGMPLTADPHKMIECFHKAAALRPFIKPPGNRVFPHQGVAEAENELGVCYRDGIPAPVVKADLKRAFLFFLKSAEHDYPVGQYNVAIAYSTGRGTPVDAFAARMWTSRAAQHGLPEAQQYLAQLFEKGYGGRRDESQAREWTLTATQNRLTDLLMKHDFADVGVTVFGGGDIANKFSNNPAVSQRGKEVFQEFYGAYLDETNNESGPDFSVGVDSDNDEIQITKVSSYTPSATSSSDHFGRAGIYRPHSAVISTEIQGRAKAGGITACKYLASEKLVESAEKLLATGDIKGALRDLKKADLLWERPKSVFTSGANQKALLAKTLKEAAVSFQINPRDIDAAYVIGRWEMMSDQDVILHWKRCVKMHPNEASFHFYLGTAYLTLERYNDSMDSIEAALAIEKKPDWFFWFAAPMIGLGMIDPAMSVYKEYVDSNPPDERFIPDAYYSIGALYFKKYDNAMATVYHELGQMAESVAIRFPAFYPKVLFDTAKETLRSGMKKNGYMESSVVASVMAQNMVECGFCKSIIKPTQLLSHKLSKCPRRTVVCELCNDRMVFDALQAHSQSRHAVAGKSKKKKGKGKKRAQSTAQNAPAPQPVVKTETSVTYPAPTRSDNLQELTTPKFHFAGAILEITKGKSTSNQTVFSLQTVLGQRWMLRVNDNLPPAGSSPLFDISKAIDGAAVDNSMLVFWRRPPPLETIDRRALAVPMEGEVYGQDVIIYILKCSSQALGFELCQLRHNKYMENGSLCAGCDNPAYPGEKLSTCSACKTVKYCSRDCQRTHWKRIHRHMCQNATLLSNCITMSEDVTPDERDGPRKQAAGRQQENATPANVRHEDTVYVDNTLEILEDILKNTKSKGDAWNGEDVIEYCMLPPRDLSRPGAISGSVRMFRRSVKGAKEFVAEFAVGYLTSSPTLLQQQELHYFFQIPPHNPLKLKCDGTLVYLDKCTVHTDDTSSRGFRLVMQMPLATYSLQAIAELLDYLLSNTNIRALTHFLGSTSLQVAVRERVLRFTHFVLQ
ncbi:hypothetical protein PF011_g19639 [Phytophthora fragariae]|uniref:MYND-type domain-containing protein n=1 Tax=Phytophthora fragariae TaxID=53985 RepID=A0A6A3J1J9_9STRA|nr:hypothetical protein PF011_g19639 [Phytophthora fragariae]